MAEREFKIAIVGATGLVGSELVEALSYRRFPAGELRLFASPDSIGETFDFRGDEIEVEQVRADYYEGMDLVFFAAHPMIARDLAADAANAGAIVIDASNHFRPYPDVPLVVPEVNPEALAKVRKTGNIAASPSAAATVAAVVLAPLARKWGLKSLCATAAVGTTSGGRRAFEEHQFQTIGVFNQTEISVERFPRRAAFNVFPWAGDIGEKGDALLERELAAELPRILGAELPVASTFMTVPIFCGLSMVLSAALDAEPPLPALLDELDNAPGLTLLEDSEADAYPDTLLAMEHDEPLVGRVRKDPTRAGGYLLWVSADNLRKGAALNMVQIAETLAKVWDNL